MGINTNIQIVHSRVKSRNKNHNQNKSLFIPLIIFLLIIYIFFVRSVFSTWGSNEGEQNIPLPGDQLIDTPKISSTRAITINAKTENIYPWLVQMGKDKGGFYSYDWLENLFGLKIHSADRIEQKWQNLAKGDVLLLGPMGGPKLIDKKENRYLYFGIKEKALSNSWSFNLLKSGKNETRLIVRSKYDYPSTIANFFIWKVFTEPAHFFMEERMLRGIKERAERE